MATAQTTTIDPRPEPPEFGSFKEKDRWRRQHGIVAIGPSGPPQPPPEVDRVSRRRIAIEVERDHRQTVEAEIAAVDRHVADVDRRIEALSSTSRGDPGELVAERRQLAELRQMLVDDLAAGPVTTDRDGRPVGDHTRAYIKFRTRELAESFWANAARADAEGDHRRGRTLRRDALRSRMIAENEMGLRRSLPGYGLAAWT